MIRPRHRTIQCEVFFHDAGSQGNRGERDFDTERVIRVANRDTERLRHRLHGAQIHIGRICGVRARALEKNDLLVASPANCVRNCRHFFFGRHAGRNNQWLPEPRDVLDKGKVRNLAGRDLERNDPEPVQQIGAILFKRRRQEQDVPPRAPGHQVAMSLLGQLQPAKHGDLRFRSVRPARLVVRLRGALNRKFVGLERLELHRVRAGICRRVHQFFRQGRVAVVVHSGFGNYETGLTGADAVFPDTDGLHLAPRIDSARCRSAGVSMSRERSAGITKANVRSV